jgi:hypothetical protein
MAEWFRANRYVVNMETVNYVEMDGEECCVVHFSNGPALVFSTPCDVDGIRALFGRVRTAGEIAETVVHPPHPTRPEPWQ